MEDKNKTQEKHKSIVKTIIMTIMLATVIGCAMYFTLTNQLIMHP